MRHVWFVLLKVFRLAKDYKPQSHVLLKRRARRDSRRFRIRLVSPGMRTVEQTRQIDLLSDGSLFYISPLPS